MVDDRAQHTLTVVGVVQHGEQDPPQVVLRDDTGRQLELPIGMCEAVAIQLPLEKVKIRRPFTHDLLLILAEHLEVTLERVIIDDFSKGTYYARLILTGPEGQISLDCRPSDGIAVALRAKIPILATEAVMCGEEHTE